MVEASRKHGPFDTRWPYARKASSDAATTVPPLRAAEAAEALDWNAFSNRYLASDGGTTWKRVRICAYKQGREWRTTSAR